MVVSIVEAEARRRAPDGRHGGDNRLDEDAAGALAAAVQPVPEEGRDVLLLTAAIRTLPSLDCRAHSRHGSSYRQDC